MKTFVTTAVLAAGVAFAAAQPAQAAFVLICPSAACGAAPDTTTFFAGDFEAGFNVNGSQTTIGLGNSATTPVFSNWRVRRRRGEKYVFWVPD